MIPLLLLLLFLPYQFCKEQLIVSYHRYLSTLERKQVLLSCLATQFDWYTIPKSRYVERFESDFSVIYVGHRLDEVRPSLVSHHLVRDVVSDKVIENTLKY